MSNFVKINMDIFKITRKITVTCNNRLSAYLQEEIESLGFTISKRYATGVELEGTLQDCIKLNLNLFCASQVLFSIKKFKANNADELYQQVLQIAWENIIPHDGYFTVSSHVYNDTILTPLFANVKVKDAIVDKIKSKVGTRPNSGPETDQAAVNLFWREDEAEIFLDTSGDTLAKHGYRKIPGKAPMLEALAAGVLRATKWDKKSPLINPMCGSGTLAIEAALWATNRKPGLIRLNYSFMHFIGYDSEVFYEERRLLKKEVNKDLDFKIIASDLSREAVEVSKINAKLAGVLDLIDFHVCDFAETPVIKETPGVLIFNPEYGERLGVHSKLELTYGRMGDFMKKECEGYRGYIFTGNPDLAKKIGLKASRRIEFYNGKLDCRLLEYELYKGTKNPVKEEVKVEPQKDVEDTFFDSKD